MSDVRTKSVRDMKRTMSRSRSTRVGLVRAKTERSVNKLKGGNGDGATDATTAEEPNRPRFVVPVLAFLVSLDLSSTALVDSQLLPIIKSLRVHKRIARLNLCRNELGTDPLFAKQLCTLVSAQKSPLRQLLLGWNRFNDETSKILLKGLCGRGRALRSIGLQFNSIGDAGALMAAKVLTDTINIQHMDLRFNRCTAASATALGNALRTNTGLAWIGLDGNAFGDEGTRVILDGAEASVESGKLVVTLGLKGMTPG
jgi:Ran GTPase-activating protein (RanGAP) involved in mRNA processing and transport